MMLPNHNAATWIAGILALCGADLGGAVLDAQVEAEFLKVLETANSLSSRLRAVPSGMTLEGLSGSLDLAATLATGKPVYAPGILDSGQSRLLIRRADRLDPACVSALASAIDDGHVFLCAVLDLADEETSLLPKLANRLPFLVRETADQVWSQSDVVSARDSWAGFSVSEQHVTDLSEAALAFGISSPRAVLHALKTARAIAALSKCDVITDDILALTVQLVFAHLATRMPVEDDEVEAPQQQQEPEQSQDDQQAVSKNVENAERLVEAVKSALPADLLQSLVAQHGGKSASRSMKLAGQKASGTRGRRIGHKRATSLSRQRLDVLATLRCAAPWQTLRRKHAATDRMVVTRDDFRVTRIKQRNQTTAIFAVDASGSTAFQRLAEAKGAVEAVLAECYVRRDHVALVSFRSKTAEILLPPTRSLERAKRALNALPGGGGTPLAAGLDHAFALALQVRRSGQTPTVIMLTDGRANVTRSGEGNKVKAQEETLSAARLFASERIDAMVIDVSPDPQKHARALAEAMGARYLPMPRAGAMDIARPVRQAMAALSS